MEGHILNTRYGVDDDNASSLREDALDFALIKGISMRVPDLSKDVRVPLPFTLVPSTFPKVLYQKVLDLQPYINSVLLQVANSKETLVECLSSTIEADNFTRNIFKIYESVENENQTTLGLIRTDYLLNCSNKGNITGIKNVENNTIASSYAGLSPVVRELHEFVLGRLGQKALEDKMPINQSVFTLAQGIVSAWDIYGKKDAVVLFVVEDFTINICDQRVLEYAILEYENNLKILRCTFKDLRHTASLRGKTLIVKDQEVAVVYYRYGYMPDQYETEDWETRLKMERSSAIKCPSAGLHLAGSKKVQVHMSKPGVLERFVPKECAEKLRQLFVELHSLETGPSGDCAVSKGLKAPENYVLKPEREGGGNNLYDGELKSRLEEMQHTDERNAYILMERINPPAIPNCIIRRDSEPEFVNVQPELGIYGAILGNKHDIHINKVGGYLLRSKPTNVMECGITVGFGVLDSLYLE